MKMPQIFNASVLALALLAATSLAHANAIVRLKRPAFACRSKPDAEFLQRTARQLKNRAQIDALGTFAAAHCIWLNGGTFSLLGKDGGFDCISASPSCVWLPGELLQSTGVDDGVF
jgi:hypothetical protein